MLTDGIQVTAGTYIYNSNGNGSVSLKIIPLLNGNIYDGGNSIVETNITPWELTTRLKTLKIDDESPF